MSEWNDNEWNDYIKKQLDFNGHKVVYRLDYEKALFNILMKVKKRARQRLNR